MNSYFNISAIKLELGLSAWSLYFPPPVSAWVLWVLLQRTSPPNHLLCQSFTAPCCHQQPIARGAWVRPWCICLLSSFLCLGPKCHLPDFSDRATPVCNRNNSNCTFDRWCFILQIVNSSHPHLLFKETYFNMINIIIRGFWLWTLTNV